MEDTIVQTNICRHCQISFPISQADMEFYAKISPTFDGQIFAVPAPTLCPDCRQRRRLAFRNERNLYRRTCDASGKQIISIYSPEKPYKVYDQKTRWSDSRNPMDYGRDFDFSKTFTEQYDILVKGVPLPALYNTISLLENSEYVNYTSPAKNSYMVIEGTGIENCYYSRSVVNSNNVVDGLFVYSSQHCYNSINLYNCSNVHYSQFCDSCSDAYFIKDCKNCHHCFMCSGLSGKSYCINNVQYSQEEYMKYIQGQKLNGFKMVKGNFETNINAINCSGSYIFNSNNIKVSSDVNDSENCKFLKMTFNCKNCYDLSHWGDGCELCYEDENAGRNVFQSAFCYTSYDHVSRGYYLYNTVSSHDCFGCVGLRNKSYCIFNKQYTKEEYEKKVAKIIAHMQETGERGEFFHPSLSPFGYNETVAQEYYPAQKDDLASLGYKRSEYESPKPVSDKVIQGKDLPATIEEVEDSILQSAIACEVTGKLFRIQPQELAFYRKHNIPLPRKHPDQRHLERLQLRK